MKVQILIFKKPIARFEFSFKKIQTIERSFQKPKF